MRGGTWLRWKNPPLSERPEYRFEQPDRSRPRGSIFLIHGSAPFDIDGRIPLDGLDSPYGREPFYRDLAEKLVSAGWSVLRYAKPGVECKRIDTATYARTDLELLFQQLSYLWGLLPPNLPRTVFAWSEGSLHIRALPIQELDAVILLGAIGTDIGSVIEWQGGPPREELQREFSSMDRRHMLGLDRPVGRLVDELALPPNWIVFSARSDLPILVLHGDADREVPFKQSAVWRKKLPHHHVTVIRGSGLDHRFMSPGNYDLKTLTTPILAWLDKLFRRP